MILELRIFYFDVEFDDDDGVLVTTVVVLMASDRFNINSQLEHLQAKYVGTGHADLTRFEWAVNIARDSYASYVGHSPMLAYFSIAENESIGRQRYNLMQKMLLPCGLPPEREDE
ncbi:RNA splicing factor [Lithospermum erythrorhizon]|uniref:RNA splicing factor n=1 Tax=Lithospermum erythrorhizon TaxID=34254 RepID=A0AAV3PHE7_LITER